MAFGYAYLGLLLLPQPDVAASFFQLGSMLLAFSCSGLFVRYFNDFCDLDQDQRAGKHNIALPDSPSRRRLNLLGYSAAIPLVLWISGAPFILYLLMGLQHLLYLLYSIPPIRLKERNWLGLLCDAAYGHAIPAAAGFAFGYTAGAISLPEHLWLYVAFAGFSQFALGISNIVYHQLEDYPYDRHAGVLTWVVKATPDKALYYGQRFFIPLSYIFLVAYYLLWAVDGLFFLASLIVIPLLLLALRSKKLSLSQSPKEKALALITANEITEIWAPLFILIALIPVHKAYFWLLVIHSIGFWQIISPYALCHTKRIWGGWKWLEGRLIYFYYHKLLIAYARLKNRFFS